MSKKIIIKNESGECISVDCDKLMSFGNDPEYIAVVDNKMYKKTGNNIYEFVTDIE
jgi:hypothetical protein